MSGSDVTGWIDTLVLPFSSADMSATSFSSVCPLFFRSLPSPLPPEGREEVGDGRRLVGAVEGDIPADENPPFRGDVVEGNEGVDAWRPVPPRCSPGPRSTRYDNGGGGAKGESSSLRSKDRNELRGTAWVSSLCDDPPLTSFQILAKPLRFFLGFSSVAAVEFPSSLVVGGHN